VEKKPVEVARDLDKLEFTYNAHINKMVAKTCEGKTGDEFKQCYKEHSEIISDIYSLEDFYSDNFNSSRNNQPSFSVSLNILKNILK
jgi:hypothetical protein